MGKLRKINSRTDEKWFEIVGESCPICGSQGWCLINEGQNKAICMRKKNEGELRSSSYEKDGQRLYQTDVLVSNFTRLEKSKNATGNESVFGHSEPMDIADDDLPF